MEVARLTSVATAVLMVTACGDGGGQGLASVPAPVLDATALGSAATSLGFVEASRAALPPTPANTTGTYQAISAYQSFVFDSAEQITSATPTALAPSGSATLTIDSATRTYSMAFSGGPTAFATGTVQLPATSPLGHHVNYVEKFSDGSTRAGPSLDVTGPGIAPLPDQTFASRKAGGEIMVNVVPAGTGASGAPRVQLDSLGIYNVGYVSGAPRYVSLAEWGQSYRENNTGSPGAENFKSTVQTSGVMVFGPRTAATDMPVSGTAQYLLNVLPPSAQQSVGTTLLTMDFASRQLSAVFDAKRDDTVFQTDDDGNPLLDTNGKPVLYGTFNTALHAAGVAVVGSTPDFTVPLAGSGTVVQALKDQPVTQVTAPLNGSITGAFFGPQGAEIGGFAALPDMNTEGGAFTHDLMPFAAIKQ